uniref:Reverse transcriptase zinc-binding domain-containing protein n=1 Tax=Solanum tuberosum TaxID=4113 RepID=M0ZSF6_SOLTU
MQGWEVERLAEFYGTLDQYTGPKEGEDTPGWKCHNKGFFIVSSAYKNLNKMRSRISFLPRKLIWKVKIPYKVVAFAWMVVKEAALTQENLMKRGIQCVQDAIFVSKRQRQSTICIYTVKWLANYGTCLLVSEA